MKITVPVTDVDSLLTREDFIKQVEECVNSETARIIGVALHNVTAINAQVAQHIFNILNLTKQVYMYDPELSTSIRWELTQAANNLGQLNNHFEIEKGMAEAVNATKH